MFITDVTLSPELFHLKVNDVVNVMFEDICIRKNPAAPLVAIIFQVSRDSLDLYGVAARDEIGEPEISLTSVT